MSLSDKEQQILDQLESQLRSEDPGLERRASRLTRAPGPRALARSIALFAVGFGLLLLLTFSPLFAIAGTALMLVAIVHGAQALATVAREQVSQAKAKASRTDDN